MSWEPEPTWLFCPANRPERYTKALAISDVVILDLEDAVPQANKSGARDAIRTLVTNGDYNAARTVLRISGATDPQQHELDVALINETGIDRVMLAKAANIEEVTALGSREVIALLETARGVDNARQIATAPNAIGLMWGADDLVASLGGIASRHTDGHYHDVARVARSQVLITAKAAGLLALDAVYMDIADLPGLRAECEQAAAVGFDAKVAIHPSQVPVIRAAYRPPAQRIDWAMRLLQTVGSHPGVTTFEGRMVDGPIYKQAERTLSLANSTNTRSPDALPSTCPTDIAAEKQPTPATQKEE